MDNRGPPSVSSSSSSSLFAMQKHLSSSTTYSGSTSLPIISMPQAPQPVVSIGGPATAKKTPSSELLASGSTTDRPTLLMSFKDFKVGSTGFGSIRANLGSAGASSAVRGSVPSKPATTRASRAKTHSQQRPVVTPVTHATTLTSLSTLLQKKPVAKTKPVVFDEDTDEGETQAPKESFLSEIESKSLLQFMDSDLCRQQFVQRTVQEISVACALCQLHDTSRFGQGAIITIPIATQFPPAFEIQNNLKEKQQFDLLSGVGHDILKPFQNILTIDSKLPIHQNCLNFSSVARFDPAGNCVNILEVVASSLLKPCSWCGHYGASVVCADLQCSSVFHYPCAAASDCYMRLQDRMVLCPQHHSALGRDVAADDASCCVVCGEFAADDVGSGAIKDLLFCFTCGRHMHIGCMGISSDCGPVRKAGFQCDQCKACTVCKANGKSDKVVCCCDCGRDYHLQCASLSGVPKLAWKCTRCRACTHCGKRTPGGGPSCKWHQNYSLCDSCYQQKVKGSVCTVCQKAYRFADQREMTKCNGCGSYTHNLCDIKGADGGNYTCLRCLRPHSFGDLTGTDANPHDLQSAALTSVMNHSSSPSSSSIFSSSLDDGSVAEQSSEFSGSGGGKPLGRLKRRQVSQPSWKTGRKRQRTSVANPFAPPAGRKRGKGKSLPLIIPPTKADIFNKTPEESGGGSDDDSVHTSSVVIFRASDGILQAQDICVSCGSIGLGDEGKLIGCAQCGQCYHTYCAGVKLNSVILTKGWRCLDCTVCEGCGKPHDEGRLILCDECDISFHIYCLDPPLDHVPQGTWKCKWCVCCQYCGSTSPGHGSCAWQNNYSTCTPCASLQKCPVCDTEYAERELIMQCLQCDRWLHASCDAIMDEDDVEAASSIGYVCPFCRPENHPPLHLQHVFEDDDSVDYPVESSAEPKPVVMHKFDGMVLSEVGLKHVKQLSLEHAKPKVSKKKAATSKSQERALPLGDFGSDSALNNASSQDSDKVMEDASVEDKKKRVRRPQRFGIGGFLLRGPKPKAEKEKDSMDLQSMDTSFDGHTASGTLSPTESLDTHLTELAGLDPSKHPGSSRSKKKKSAPRKKMTMRDVFPDYLQDAFFGRNLLDGKSDTPQDNSTERLSLLVNIDQPDVVIKSQPKNQSTAGRNSADDKKPIKLEPVPSDLSKLQMNKPPAQAPVDVPMPDDEDDFGDFPDDDENLGFLTHDLPEDEILGILMAVGGEQEEDTSSQEDESSLPGQVPRPAKDSEHDPITDNFASILDSLEDLPQITCEDTDDVFNVFMNDDSAGPSTSRIFQAPEAVSSVSSVVNSNVTRMVFPSTSAVDQGPLTSSWPPPIQQQMSQMSQSSLGDENGEAPEGGGNSHKTVIKWEQDETLGDMATISAVLYANIRHPDLRQKFPEFTERYKQISKLWRKVSTDERQPFLGKARENRTAVRATKSQRAKEEKAAAAVIKAPERQQVATFIGPGYVGTPRYSQQDSIESPYYNGPQDDLVFPNPATPQSQPSTPGSSASHAAIHQQYHVGSPAPPFSPPLDRPRSVLPTQHLISDQQPNYNVQSPGHSYQQVQSPRTPYPPSSPFDPYAHPPASVPASLSRQSSQDYSVMDEHDPYAQPPGTPMPQRFPQQYSHQSNPQSPQQGQGGYFPQQQGPPRQQLRDLLARQNLSRQRQQISPNAWQQYPNQQQQPCGFPPPQQVEQHYAARPPQAFPQQRQEFRQPPPPPQPRMMQQLPRNMQMLPQQQQRFQMVPRVQNHTVMQQRPSPPGALQGGPQFNEQQHMYERQQWQQQQQMLDQQQYGQPQYQDPNGYGHLDSQQQQPQIRPEYMDNQYQNYRAPPMPVAYGPRSPNMVSPPLPQGPRPPMQWTSPQQQQQFAQQLPPRAQSVAPPPVQSPPIQMQPPNELVQNGEGLSEAERHRDMTQESWMREYYHKLTTSQTKMEAEIAHTRKQRKSVAARQRQLKKNNAEPSQEDLAELERLTQQVSTIQKDLEKIRKENKQHKNIIDEYEAKTGIRVVQTLPLPQPPSGMPNVPGLQAQVLRPPGRPGMTSPQYGPPSVPPPGPNVMYNPQNVMMSPKREEQYPTQPQYPEQQYYPDQNINSLPRPPLPRFSVQQQQHPQVMQQHQQQFPHPVAPSPQHSAQFASQSFPPEPKIQPVPQSPYQSMDFAAPSPAGLEGQKSPLSKPVQMKMEPLSTPTSEDGRNVFNFKRSSVDSNSSLTQNLSDDLMDDKPNEKKNILLKQLLEQGNAAATPTTPGQERKHSLKPSTDDEDDASASSLTPAQQHQLALIESMPLTLRKDSTSSSPVNLLAAASELMNLTPEVKNDGAKKKNPKKKKKKDAAVESDAEAVSSSNDPPPEAVVSSLMEQLRHLPAALFEPDKCSLPAKSIFIKSESDAAPVPVGKKLEDLKKPQRRTLQGTFGRYEVVKHGSKSKFYVGVTNVNDELMTPADETSAEAVFEEIMQLRSAELQPNMKSEEDIKIEIDDEAPFSPALSFVSTSSYGESRLLESCYDFMYNWLDFTFPQDEPPSCEIRVTEPTLEPAPSYHPGTPNSVKENWNENNCVKTENTTTTVAKPGKLLKDSDRVNVSMTITEEAARDINHFLQGLASLLQIPVSEIVMTECEQDDMAVVPDILKDEKAQKFCRTCEVTISSSANHIRKRLSDFPFASMIDNGFPVEMDGGTAYLSFCSQQCLMQFAINNQTGAKASPPATVSVDHGVDGCSKIETKKERQRETPPVKRLSTVQMILKSIAPLLRRGKKTRYEHWTNTLLQVKKVANALEPMTPSQVLNALDVGIRGRDGIRDSRHCLLCLLVGDFLTDGPGRLLNIDGDHWVHLNCALWSTEVYETINGHLINVQEACKRGARTECVRCRKPGATMGCYKQPKIRCNQVLHFPCAQESGCMFFSDKSILCEAHKPKEPTEGELKSMLVLRRVCVQRDETRLAATLARNPDGVHSFRVGTLIFHAIGQIHLASIQAFHTENCIYPVGFSITRIFWSMRALHKRCYYHCSIHEANGFPEFHIVVKEVAHEDVHLTDSTTKGVWMKVLSAVLSLRPSSMIKVFPDFFTGDDLFGLTDQNIAKAIESLHGASDATRYRPRFTKSHLTEAPMTSGNVSGSARTEPKLKLQHKRGECHHSIVALRPLTAALRAGGASGGCDLLGSISSQLQGTTSSSPGITDNPFYLKQISHSRINQYRKMKAEWKNSVYLARSKIQGLGLFASRELEKNTMIIEYVGELIRNEVANHRERVYDQMNHAGIYMFRVDQNEVCDASRAGGPARFINHSCDPNCITEIVQTDKDDKKIVISSIRKILKGEELCYDYKFDFEDDQHKIACNCGARNCRLWMN